MLKICLPLILGLQFILFGIYIAVGLSPVAVGIKKYFLQFAVVYFFAAIKCFNSFFFPPNSCLWF